MPYLRLKSSPLVEAGLSRLKSAKFQPARTDMMRFELQRWFQVEPVL